MRNISILVIAVLVGVFFVSPNVDAASEKKKESSSYAEYIKLDPLLLPIIDDDGVQQIVSMVVAIEVQSAWHGDKVRAMRPKLTDAYISDMYGILNKHAALKGGIIQVRMIKDRLNDITDEIVGDKIDTEVLLQVVQQRPI